MPRGAQSPSVSAGHSVTCDCPMQNLCNLERQAIALQVGASPETCPIFPVLLGAREFPPKEEPCPDF